ncbi:hypothetical protein [Weissella viridescens]|nr:hypothetical protein [Weissella viridescens]
MSSKTSDVSDDSSGIDSESNTVDENTSSTVVSESSQTVDPSENDGTASEGDDEMISTLPSDVSPDGAGNYVSADGMTAYIPQGNGKYITLPTSSTPYTGRGYLKQLQLAEYKRENLEKGINQLSDTQKQNLEKIGKN